MHLKVAVGFVIVVDCYAVVVVSFIEFVQLNREKCSFPQPRFTLLVINYDR